MKHTHTQPFYGTGTKYGLVLYAMKGKTKSDGDDSQILPDFDLPKVVGFRHHSDLISVTSVCHLLFCR